MINISDASMGVVIGSVLAIKHILEQPVLNAHSLAINVFVLYIILGFKIGFSCLKLVTFLITTSIAYSVCLRPQNIMDGAVADLTTAMADKFKQSLNIGRQLVDSGVRISTNAFDQLMAA